MNQRPTPARRDQFVAFLELTTRWSDNDAYGHINNVVYYAFFDAAVNQILIEAGALDPVSSPIIGMVVETTCTHFASLKYPQRVEVGVSVEAIGRSSVRYKLAAFGAGDPAAAAQARYTHVYVDRATQKPVPIPDNVRAILTRLQPA